MDKSTDSGRPGRDLALLLMPVSFATASYLLALKQVTSYYNVEQADKVSVS